jgi:FMN phosphatase YigB (HAD superfamily)
MSATLLFDLDDTLLSSNMDTFLPAYFKALAKFLSHRFEGGVLIQRLLYATQKMIGNNRPDRTLEQVFDAHFYPALGVKRDDVRAEIDAFYSEIFPTLKSFTAPRPDAVRLVDEAVRRGYRLVIATSPIFPLTAILQRLGWAGLSAADYPFELITSYETFHFAKPNPAYYTEVLAQIGWPSGPVVMVGNDPDNDITPARQIGLFTYLINEGERSGGAAHGTGSFADVLPWIDQLESQPPPVEIGSPAALLPTLRATPAALNTLTAGLPSDAWSIRPQPTEWGLNEIFCHLRDVAVEVDLPRIRRVLAEENPFLPAMDTDPLAENRSYAAQDGTEALSDFTLARIQLLDQLQTLTMGEWERPARHAIFGPTHLRELVSFIATHDRVHIQQSRSTIQAAIQDLTPAAASNITLSGGR